MRINKKNIKKNITMSLKEQEDSDLSDSPSISTNDFCILLSKSDVNLNQRYSHKLNHKPPNIQEKSVNIQDIPVTSNSFNKTMILEPTGKTTYNKYNVLIETIRNLPVKAKRRLFADMRTSSVKVTPDTFFPLYGFTAGEFTTMAVLTENNRKKK